MPIVTERTEKRRTGWHWVSVLLWVVLGGVLLLVCLAAFMPMKAVVISLPPG